MDGIEVITISEAYEDLQKGYVGFKKLAGEIAKKKGARDAGAIAASIGMKKYGKKKFKEAAKKGKKMKGMKPKK